MKIANLKKSKTMLTNKSIYQSMSEANNPYGDGKASQRILDICTNEILNEC